MAKTVQVLPRDDGHDFQGSWMIHAGGQMKSNHTTKQAARNAARRVANQGDEMIVHRTDGTIQERFTVQKASTSDSNDQAKERYDMFGVGTFETALGFDR